MKLLIVERFQRALNLKRERLEQDKKHIQVQTDRCKEVQTFQETYRAPKQQKHWLTGEHRRLFSAFLCCFPVEQLRRVPRLSNSVTVVAPHLGSWITLRLMMPLFPASLAAWLRGCYRHLVCSSGPDWNISTATWRIAVRFEADIPSPPRHDF